MDAFNMDAIGKASVNELDLRTQLGTQSGPDDFEIEIVDNSLIISSGGISG
jgi:hypothetical protein